MRVGQVVRTLFSDKAFIQKANFLSGIKGGWERWFQMELAYFIASRYASTYNISLEDNTVYPGTALRADLVLRCRVLSKTTTVVELKCQTAAAPTEDFYKLMEADIDKIPALEHGDDYQVIALVRDWKDVELLYDALAKVHPNQVSGCSFPISLATPGGFVSFYQSG